MRSTQTDTADCVELSDADESRDAVPLATDDLIDEISIDGMCGVY
ncbi:mycofactocin precursor MftA [Nocardioides KLBMP 9356]|uniref:Mycofactocin MftA n=1 Tax=Nocardioides potassii TaxID=2911371 RepID=A0ABS9HDH2_9ACTN|nr:mycofactocin precursor MftA [Nocardioides potassii]MCF6378128.1 mycofactocin precursor MftA [Nocardioides potassii]